MGDWCGREDSNFHSLSATSPSSLRVYQFHHVRRTGIIVTGFIVILKFGILSAVPFKGEAMQPAQETDSAIITAEDIFGGIFSILVIRGYKKIQPNQPSCAYDSACQVVYLRVLELCEEQDKVCDFVILPHMTHGDSQVARDQLRIWLSARMMHFRTPGDGSYYFSITPRDAEFFLNNSIRVTGFGRKIFDELTDIFLDSIASYSH